MTNLELTLANVLASIDEVRAAGNVHALVALLERKHAICQALAAPEHAWEEAPVDLLSHMPHQRSEAALAAA
jgi:hypothetical protein